MKDPWDDPEAKAWMARAHETLVPMIDSSALSVSIAPQGRTDIKFAVELGLTIMFDKPIIVIAHHEQDVPPKLRQVADEVVVGDLDDAGVKDRLQEAITRVYARLEADEK